MHRRAKVNFHGYLNSEVLSPIRKSSQNLVILPFTNYFPTSFTEYDINFQHTWPEMRDTYYVLN
jgi:hypothetical protein